MRGRLDSACIVILAIAVSWIDSPTTLGQQTRTERSADRERLDVTKWMSHPGGRSDLTQLDKYLSSVFEVAFLDNMYKVTAQASGVPLPAEFIGGMADREREISRLRPKLPESDRSTAITAIRAMKVEVESMRPTPVDPTGVGSKHTDAAILRFDQEIAALDGASKDGDWIKIGQLGPFVGDKFGPTGDDMESNDRSEVEGRLSEQEFLFHRGRMYKFLQGRKTVELDLYIGKPTESELRNVINVIIRRWEEHSGALLPHPDGSELSQLVASSSPYSGFRDALYGELQILWKKRKAGDGWSTINVNSFLAEHRISFPDKKSIPFTLRAALGGTQGIQVYVKDGSELKNLRLRVVIWDVFGANAKDRYFPGLELIYFPPLESMWQIQHRTNRVKPFHHSVEIIQTLPLGPGPKPMPLSPPQP